MAMAILYLLAVCRDLMDHNFYCTGLLTLVVVSMTMLWYLSRSPSEAVAAPSKAVQAPAASPGTSVTLEPMDSRPVRLEHSLTDDFIDELDEKLAPYRKHRKA